MRELFYTLFTVDDFADEFDDDFEMPKGCKKIEKLEKIVVENGIQRKVTKVIKHMENGSIETEIFKEDIK